LGYISIGWILKPYLVRFRPVIIPFLEEEYTGEHTYKFENLISSAASRFMVGVLMMTDPLESNSYFRRGKSIGQNPNIVKAKLWLTALKI
jgi:hypothetical protein